MTGSTSTAVVASAVAVAHEWLAWAMVALNAAAGLWAFGAHRHDRWRGRALWAITVIAQVTVFAQAGLGSWLVAREGRPAPDLHALYGFSAVVAVGIAYSYRQQLARHVFLLYGATGLVLMGLGIRAMILD